MARRMPCDICGKHRTNVEECPDGIFRCGPCKRRTLKPGAHRVTAKEARELREQGVKYPWEEDERWESFDELW